MRKLSACERKVGESTLKRGSRHHKGNAANAVIGDVNVVYEVVNIIEWWVVLFDEKHFSNFPDCRVVCCNNSREGYVATYPSLLLVTKTTRQSGKLPKCFSEKENANDAPCL